MKELPILISIASHIFFNPVLFFMIALAIDSEKGKNENIGRIEAAGDHRIAYRLLAQTYVLGTILCYGMFITALYLVLRLFGLTPNLDAFIDTQFNYYSLWRLVIVAVMVLNIYLWAAKRETWASTGLILGPATLVCAVAQIVLFFKHLY